jgi:hypothetical protein
MKYKQDNFSKKILFFLILLFIGLISATVGQAENNKITKTNYTKAVTPVIQDKFSLWENGTQLRGANIFQRRVYIELDGPDYMGPGPFGPPFTQSDFNNLSKSGANLVVLSHPGIFNEKPPYALNKSVQANLDRLIGMAEKANLFVVISARTGPGRSEFTFMRDGAGIWFDKSYLNEDVWKDRSIQDAYVAMWRYTAQRYRNNPTVIGYELMVEPNADDVLGLNFEPKNFYPKYENTTYDWNVLASRITHAIREVDQEMPILVDGMGYSAVRWLPYIKPTGDKRTVYIIHQYEPQEAYTHQEGDLTNTYPGKFDTNGDGIIENFNKAWIDNLLTPVDCFKKSVKAPVAVTEYGCERWELGADAFLDDEMILFEKRGMNYAIWNWAPSFKPFTDIQNDFNFRFGPDKNNIQDMPSKQFSVIKNHWKKNINRPSS